MQLAGGKRGVKHHLFRLHRICSRLNFFSYYDSEANHLKTIWSLCCTMSNLGSKLFGAPIWCWGVILGDSRADRGGSSIQKLTEHCS